MRNLLTTKELAEYYHVSVRTIQRRVRERIITPVENPLGLVRFNNPEPEKAEWQTVPKSARRRILENMLAPARNKNAKTKNTVIAGID